MNMTTNFPKFMSKLFNSLGSHIEFKIRLQDRKMIVGTWQSTHVIFNLVKKPLVLVKNNTQRFFFYVSNEKNIDT